MIFKKYLKPDIGLDRYHESSNKYRPVMMKIRGTR